MEPTAEQYTEALYLAAIYFRATTHCSRCPFRDSCDADGNAEDCVKHIRRKLLGLVGYYELKPCPFCGSDAELHRDGASWYWVKCTNEECKADTRVLETNEKAAEVWNRRA